MRTRSRVPERAVLCPAEMHVLVDVIREVHELNTQVLVPMSKMVIDPEQVEPELPLRTSHPAEAPTPPDTLAEPIVPFVDA